MAALDVCRNVDLPLAPVAALDVYRNVDLPLAPVVALDVYRNVDLPLAPVVALDVYRNVDLPLAPVAALDVCRLAEEAAVEAPRVCDQQQGADPVHTGSHAGAGLLVVGSFSYPRLRSLETH